MPHCGWRTREKISSSPLVSGNIQTAADVRCRTQAPSDARIDDARRSINSCSCRALYECEGHVRYNRREKTGGQQSQVSLSAPNAAEPSTMPFAQRLTCTIDDACEVTGLGRTKLRGSRRSSPVSSIPPANAAKGTMRPRPRPRPTRRGSLAFRLAETGVRFP